MTSSQKRSLRILQAFTAVSFAGLVGLTVATWNQFPNQGSEVDSTQISNFQ